ncbi:hypothetical protein, partial [Bartonella rattaustraliani]|uniref:hypothetical protein n=1 Tax=Bartonella rattaustraliani TaxID=481139 RepID=UPI000526D6C7
MIFWFKKYSLKMTTALAVFFMALSRAFYLGRKAEQDKQVEGALKTARTRFEIENEVNRKDDNGVRS